MKDELERAFNARCEEIRRDGNLERLKDVLTRVTHSTKRATVTVIGPVIIDFTFHTPNGRVTIHRDVSIHEPFFAHLDRYEDEGTFENVAALDAETERLYIAHHGDQ